MNTQTSLDKRNTVIIGKNNSGKSTFLDGIQYAFNNLDNANRRILNKHSGVTNAKIDISIRIEKDDLREILKTLNMEYKNHFDNLLSTVFLLRWEHNKKSVLHLNIQKNDKTAQVEDDAIEKIVDTLKNDLRKKIVLIKHIGELLPSESFIPYNKFELQQDKDRYIRNYIYHLRNRAPQNYNKLNTILIDLFGIDDLSVFLDNNTGEIRLDVIKEGLELDISEMGRGFQYVTLILTKLLFSKFEIVLIDEPDTNMHVNLVRQFITLLLKNKELQIVLSTHNESVINEVNNKNIRYMRMNNYFYSVFDSSKVNTKQVLEDLGITISNSELARIINSDAIVLCEGRDDKKYLPLLIGKTEKRKILERIYFLYTGGKSFTHTEVMDELLKWNKPILSIKDRDENSEDDIKEKKQKSDYELYYLQKREIENYALNYDSLLRLINKDKKNLDQEELKQKIFSLACDLRMKIVVLKILNSITTEVERTNTSGILKKINNKLDTDLITNTISDHIISKLDKHMIRNIVDKNVKFIQNEWTPENVASICPGKKLLKKISSWVKTDFGLNIGKQNLFENLKENEVDSDIIELIKKIELLIAQNEEKEREAKKKSTDAVYVLSN